jgi:phosphoribosyl 1,2-cyclic phosphodiesterase
MRTHNFIKFLGTAGARFVMISQLRSSGGIWISFKGTDILIDPGPGSIVRCANALPKLDPGKLAAIILTHRHLDHVSDVNVMIEAMTEGGFKRRGLLFLPKDALARDSIVLKYVQGFVEKIEFLTPSNSYKIQDIKFSTTCPMKHPVETYGLKFDFAGKKVSLVSDTQYFAGLSKFFKHTDILIVNVVFLKPHNGILHLDLESAGKLITEVKPKKAVLTHFGLSMLKADPIKLARSLTKSLGIEVIAAVDGMAIDLG